MAAEIARGRRPPLYRAAKSANEGFRESASTLLFSLFLSALSLSLLVFAEGQIPSSGTIVPNGKARKYAGIHRRVRAERRDNGNPRGGHAAPLRIFPSFPRIFLRGRSSFRSTYFPYEGTGSRAPGTPGSAGMQARGTNARAAEARRGASRKTR